MSAKGENELEEIGGQKTEDKSKTRSVEFPVSLINKRNVHVDRKKPSDISI